MILKLYEDFLDVNEVLSMIHYLYSEGEMVPAYLNKTGYVSCIKIAGLPILPPLVTEDRRKILNEDRAKAVEIEYKIKRKRSSIDSGVMTGSYIECLKNIEGQDKENLAPNQLLMSDLACHENLDHDSKDTFPESEKNNTDNFLRVALADKEFREFFYNTAERIFNDNNLQNTSDYTTQSSSINLKNSNDDIHLALKNSDFTSDTEHFSNISDPSKDLESNSELNIVKSMAGGDQETVVCKMLPIVHIEETLTPPQRPVRRNSYTLESPSPVLIEHMAKEIVKNKDESIKWKSLSEKKESNKNFGFKTFLTATKPRKTWNKRALNGCPFSKISTSVSNQPTKAQRVLLKKTKTFTKIKPSLEIEDTNYSLPCSSRTSPTLLSSFTRSVDCIKSTVENALKKSESNSDRDTTLLPKVINEVNSPRLSNSRSSIISENKINNREIVPAGYEPEETSNASVLNSSFFSDGSNIEYNKDISSVGQREIHDNQISNDSHQMLLNGFATSSQTTECKGDKFQTDHSNEMDEIVSVCSSLSLSKFMPIDEVVSRPSTAEEMSTLFSELQLQHECQIAQLLEKQQREKVMLAILHSNNGSLYSRSTTNMSFYDPFYENSFTDNVILEEQKTPCSRELFPRQTSDICKVTKNYRAGDYSSAKDQEAALKLTAYVRGYLTRRLLKTEKVQQLIDVIKESLNCAFSLQSETDLKRNDLELHKRLENQLTAALYELQNIVSAPVSQRMSIIAADREKLRRPPSRPSSAISSATQKSLLRRQQSMTGGEQSKLESRTRAKSFCANGTPGLVRSASFVKSDSPIVLSSSSNRKPWR